LTTYDHVIVGSGINALVCAAILSRNTRVLVLEREQTIGGTMRSGEIAPGFTYDPLAATFVLFVSSPAYRELAAPLAKLGVTFATTESPTGVLTRDGRSLVFSRDRQANVAAFDALSPGDGARHQATMAGVEADADVLFGLLNRPLWTAGTLAFLARHAAKKGPRALVAALGRALSTSRRRLEADYTSDLVQALFAPWPLHAGLDPEQPFSAGMGEIIPFALEAFGAPVVTGGAARVPEALRTLIESRKGTVRTGADADLILPGTDGRDVRGVRLADGEEIVAPSVVCSVTPTQLYGRLLREWDLPPEIAEETRRYRYGRANMQIHYALERPVGWADDALGRVQLLHLCDGIDSVSKASNEAVRGMLPASPTVCVGQPSAADPSRAPQGKAVLWVQLPDCPGTLKGDAAGEIDVPRDGRWTDAVREAYADRVESMIEAHAPGFRDSVVTRHALSPGDIEATNVNLVGGDPYSGWCGVDQFFLFRPLPQQVNHKSAVPGVYHIGASTHPGPGLSGTSGYNLARALAPRDPIL